MSLTTRSPRPLRCARLVLATAVLMLGGGATAVATSEHFLQGQGLSAGNSYATGSSHTGTYYVQTVANHTACPAYDNSHAGYWGGAPADWTLSVCGPGTTGWSHGNSGSWHGAAYNPNASTFDSFSDAHYSW